MLKQSLPGSALTLWILFISLQIAGLPMLGLAPDKPVHQYIVDKWEVKEGLPSNSVQAISQTPDGYLWLATSGGLVRFDGITFRVIPFLESSKDKSLQSTAPGYLYLDRENILWIGSERGLTSYDYQTHRFKTYTKADGLADNHIRFITGDMNNNLWISFFPGGVTRFSKIDHTFITYGKEEGLSEEKINAIIEDLYGDMFLGTIGKGILTYSQGKFSQYDVAGLEDAHVIPMFKDSKECLWIGTTKGLFSAVNGDVKAYTSTTGLLGDHITDIHEDKNRNLWIGTTKGLTRIRKQHTAPIFENILESSKIICLFEDRENNLWVGTDHSGLKRIKDRTFFPYPPLQAHKDEILLSIYQGKGGDVWTGTLDKKLYHSSKNMKTRLVEHSELSDVAIAAIARDKNGDLWLGTNGKGVFQRKAGTLRRYGTRDGLAGDTVTSIYEDSRSNLWFSTLKGLSVYLYEKKIIKTLKPHLSGKVNNVYEDTAGNILAAAEKGLILLESGNIEAKNAIVYLRDIFVTGIYEDVTTLEESGGVYWVATRDQGLKRISKKDGTPVTYDAAAGLTAGSISRIFEDWRGFLWIMSRNNGILRINKAELNRYAGGELNRIHCRAYGLTDGLLSLEFNNEYSRSCAIKTAKGELVYLTKEGVAVVNPEKVPINQTPPGVVIEEILFDREQHPLNFGTVGYTLRGKKDFTVRFTAPTFLSPRKVVFKYRLEGVDKTEIHLPAGSERVVRYAGLESGEYKFRVTACNEEGVWNPTGVFVYFTLEPFYYQTLLFKLFVLLSVGVLLVAYYLYKKKYKTTAAKEEDSGLKEKPEEKEKYKGFHLEDAYAEECIKKLMKEVKIKKVYRDSKLTLEKLADKLSIPRHLLSRIINERLERNFSDFINYYRIEEAKTILSDPKNEKKKSSSIAFEVGFNTTAAFYNAFRKFTGTTPKEYRKEVLKKE